MKELLYHPLCLHFFALCLGIPVYTRKKKFAKVEHGLHAPL